jgi:HPt (histidine-containing phosphotransfer) domain-containing protein
MEEIMSKPINHQLLVDNVVSPSTVQDLSIIDLKLGAEIIDSDVEAAQDMVAQLCAMLPGDLEKIQAAFSEKNYPLLKELAHYVKGGVSFCGTPRLQAAVTELEKVIRPKTDPLIIEAAYAKLCLEIAAVIQEYERFFQPI